MGRASGIGPIPLGIDAKEAVLTFCIILSNKDALIMVKIANREDARSTDVINAISLYQVHFGRA